MEAKRIARLPDSSARSLSLSLAILTRRRHGVTAKFGQTHELHLRGLAESFILASTPPRPTFVPILAHSWFVLHTGASDKLWKRRRCLCIAWQGFELHFYDIPNKKRSTSLTVRHVLPQHRTKKRCDPARLALLPTSRRCPFYPCVLSSDRKSPALFNHLNSQR